MNFTHRILTVALLGACMTVGAVPTDIAQNPLTNAVSSNVKPNIMFIVDDSGSMGRRFMPEELTTAGWTRSVATTAVAAIKPRRAPKATAMVLEQFNTIYDNPRVTYCRRSI